MDMNPRLKKRGFYVLVVFAADQAVVAVTPDLRNIAGIVERLRKILDPLVHFLFIEVDDAEAFGTAPQLVSVWAAIASKPWLDNAIARNDPIVLATKPSNDNLYRLDSATGKSELTAFGREFNYLLDHGYSFDSKTMQMIKGK